MTSDRRNRPPSGRRLTVKVKTAKRRKTSSTKWLQRQLNDPYVADAQRAGYRSRAAFKLVQLDDRFQLLKPGHCVLDLGAAPGGWAQVAAERVRGKGNGRVVAVDLSEMDPIDGVEVIKADIVSETDVPELIERLGRTVDVVLSDMSPATTGHKGTDHLRSMMLCEAAHDIARSVLRPGGALIAKAFQGGAQAELMTALKRDFTQVKHVKPQASRPESPEIYVVATGFRGSDETAD